MIKTITEVLQIADIDEKIAELKRHRGTELPERERLMADWLPSKHDVSDKEKRKDEYRIIGKEERDPVSGKIIKQERRETVPVNRISLPLEQDIVNIHTAFTVGTNPDVSVDTDNEDEKALFNVIKIIDRKNKTKYLNKKVVRSWLSETEVSEYWYVVKDDGFWRVVLSKIKAIFGKTNPEYKLKYAVWSPFRGDVLYPFFEETGDYKALSREFRLRESDTEFITYFMTVTDTHVYTWKQAASGWEVVPKQTFAHGFKKNPTIYSYRRNTLCENIRQIRNRLETILSNYADCIDYNFAPKLVAVGEILNNNPKASRGGLVQVENGGDLKYLSWQQSPEAAKLEIDTLLEQAYSLTNTPRISFENLKGTGSALSGVAFKFAFMGIHTAVQNHAETIGEHLQRRYNFLASAVGSINTAFEKASETIDLDVEIVPYTLDNLKDNVGIAVEAVSGGVASKRTGIVLAGLIDAEKADEELKAIEADEQDKRIAVHTEE